MPLSPRHDDFVGLPPRHWIQDPASIQCPQERRISQNSLENPSYLQLQQQPLQHNFDFHSSRPSSAASSSSRNKNTQPLSPTLPLHHPLLHHLPAPPHRLPQCKHSLNSCHRRQVAERSPIPLLAHLLKGNSFVPISQRLNNEGKEEENSLLNNKIAGDGEYNSFPPERRPLQDRNRLPQTREQQQQQPPSQRLLGVRRRQSVRPLGKSLSCHLPRKQSETSEVPLPLPPQLPPKTVTRTAPKKPKLRHTRTFRLHRSEFGYGFLLSGECPTLIGSVARGCPAQEAGLRSGDVVLKVNDVYVANASHDEIVTLIGSSLDPLRLTISDQDPAENCDGCNVDNYKNQNSNKSDNHSNEKNGNNDGSNENDALRSEIRRRRSFAGKAKAEVGNRDEFAAGRNGSGDNEKEAKRSSCSSSVEEEEGEEEKEEENPQFAVDNQNPFGRQEYSIDSSRSNGRGINVNGNGNNEKRHPRQSSKRLSSHSRKKQNHRNHPSLPVHHHRKSPRGDYRYSSRKSPKADDKKRRSNPTIMNKGSAAKYSSRSSGGERLMMDIGDNKENYYRDDDDDEERNRGNARASNFRFKTGGDVDQPSLALPVRSTSRAKLAKKSSLSSLNSLSQLPSSDPSAVSSEPPQLQRRSESLQRQQQPPPTSRPPSIPPPIPPHRSIQVDPSPHNQPRSLAEFQPPQTPPHPQCRPAGRRPRPSSIQIDPSHEDADLEQLAPIYFAADYTQRSSFAGEVFGQRRNDSKSSDAALTAPLTREGAASDTAGVAVATASTTSDALGAQSSADDIRRSMSKFYPRLLLPEQLGGNSGPTTSLGRSQSVRISKSSDDALPLPVHLYEEVASDEEDGANSGRSPGRRLSDFHQSPLTRSVSHSNDGSANGAASNNVPFTDERTVGSHQPEPSIVQLCRREASENSILDSAMKGDADDPSSPEVGRAASWATKFERLLADNLGVAMFRDFLQKEFSDENMRFYLSVESFKELSAPLEAEAHRIYATFLAPDALDSVNVDAGGVARVNDAIGANINNDIFDEAQAQIFKLMKFDCYPRFLKSDAYKGAVLAEMEGRPIQACIIGDINDLVNNNKSIVDPLAAATSGGGIGRKSDFSDMRPPKMFDKDSGKIRHSLMPWNKKCRDSKIPKLNRKSFGGKKDVVNAVKKDVGSVKRPFFTSRSNTPTSAVVEKKKTAGGTSTFQRTMERLKDAGESTSCRARSYSLASPQNKARVVGGDETQFKVPSLKRFTSYSKAIRRSLGSSRESLGSLGGSRESLPNSSGGERRRRDAFADLHGREASEERVANDNAALNAEAARKDGKAVFRLDLPNQAKSLEIKARYTKPLGDIIDPLFNKYKFSSSISDVFLFNAATNSIYARADYQVLNAGAFHNQRILISIRGHHRQHVNSTSSMRRDAMVDDAGVASAGGGVGVEALSRAVCNRYDDQRGPLSAADLEIPEWLNNAEDPSSNASAVIDDDDNDDDDDDDAAFFQQSSNWKLPKGSASSSRYGSVSSLSVKSGIGVAGENEMDSITGATPSPRDATSPAFFAPGESAIPSPDVASALFADAMGHAADASLGDSKTQIDLGLGNVESPEVARNAAGDRRGGSCIWRRGDYESFSVDETLGECDRSLTALTGDLTLPDDLVRDGGFDHVYERVVDASLSRRSIGKDISLPGGDGGDVEMLNRDFRDLSLIGVRGFGDDTLTMDNSFADNTLLDNTFANNTLLDNTIVIGASTTDGDEYFLEAVESLDQSAVLDSFAGRVDDTFHGVEDRERTATTLTDVSQLSALSSVPSAISSSASDDSAPEVDNQETFL